MWGTPSSFHHQWFPRSGLFTFDTFRCCCFHAAHPLTLGTRFHMNGGCPTHSRSVRMSGLFRHKLTESAVTVNP